MVAAFSSQFKIIHFYGRMTFVHKFREVLDKLDNPKLVAVQKKVRKYLENNSIHTDSLIVFTFRASQSVKLMNKCGA